MKLMFNLFSSSLQCDWYYTYILLIYFQVNYNDGGVVDARENMDSTWQENLSDYNSDFSAPSGDSLYLFHKWLSVHLSFTFYEIEM